MRTNPTRSWRGVSAEDRRAERRKLLVEAGLDVIGTQGWAAATVRTVCRRAGLTERYFYESFADREALLLAVYDQVLVEAIGVCLEAVAQAPRDFGRTVRAVITAGVELLTGDPRKGRVLALEAMTNETLQRRRQEALQAQAALISELAHDFLGDRAPDPVDVGLTAPAMVGALAEIGGAYLDGRLDVSRERLIEHLSGLVIAAASVSSAPR
ncbi:TetR/AcrR family transcriptional regulator [Amycolatopsis anabasis]|uniref:TetR/AcrR family transcriptional regulator n=1 Tax=Amycolatopsis anabasis TaxID=1840409 RepID=UPI00131B9A2C|nr:TetR/AcrR family transcriptional regulator [Amycolatopsis anabasis]